MIRDTLLRLKSGDLTKERIEAIVNAANSKLCGGGGVDGAIHQAGGPVIDEECEKIVVMQGGCPTGEAVITMAGWLPAKYVIHTVGPIWQGGNAGEEALLRNSYRNSLRLASKNGIQRIAFPSISTGVYGYPPELAAPAALDETMLFLKEKPGRFREVVFVLFTAEILKLFEDSLTVLAGKYKVKVR